MRFAVIADIHGNHLALEAVLADIDRLGIKDTINLGDCFSGPLTAGKTFEILSNREMVTVRGNHDRYLVDRPYEQMGSWEKPVFEQLPPVGFNWIKTLPKTTVFRERVFACHATPQDDNLYWLETVTPDGRMALSGADRIEALAVGIPCPLILCGHSHVARLVELKDGRLIVNPGSVGIQAYEDDDPDQPHIMESGHAKACYAEIDMTGDDIHTTFHQVTYDCESMARHADSVGEAQWALALRRGRVLL